jgi:RHS repeat-associated protein
MSARLITFLLLALLLINSPAAEFSDAQCSLVPGFGSSSCVRPVVWKFLSNDYAERYKWAQFTPTKGPPMMYLKRVVDKMMSLERQYDCPNSPSGSATDGGASWGSGRTYLTYNSTSDADETLQVDKETGLFSSISFTGSRNVSGSSGDERYYVNGCGSYVQCWHRTNLVGTVTGGGSASNTGETVNWTIWETGSDSTTVTYTNGQQPYPTNGVYNFSGGSTNYSSHGIEIGPDPDTPWLSYTKDHEVHGFEVVTQLCGGEETYKKTNDVKLSIEFPPVDVIEIAERRAQVSEEELLTGLWSTEGAAYVKLNKDWTKCRAQRMWYILEFPIEPGALYEISWDEISIGVTGLIGVEHRSTTNFFIDGDFGYTYIYEAITPNTGPVITFVANQKACTLSPLQRFGIVARDAGCCGGDSEAEGSRTAIGGPGASVRGLNLRVNLGATDFGRPAGTIEFLATSGDIPVIKPSGLSISSLAAGTVVITNVAGEIRQVKATQANADIETISSNKFAIHVFPTSVMGPLTNGLYSTNGATESVIWRLEHDTAETNFHRYLVSEVRGSSVITNEYRFESDHSSGYSNLWTIIAGNGLAKYKSWAEVPEPNPDSSGSDPLGSVFNTYWQILNPANDTVLYQERKEYTITYNGGYALTEFEKGIGEDAEVTTFVDDFYGNRLKTIYPDGRWSAQQYTSINGEALSSQNSPFPGLSYADYLSSASNSRGISYSYGTVDESIDQITVRPHMPRVETHYALGKEVGWTYRIASTNANGNLVWIKEYRLSNAAGQLTDSDTLVTTNQYFTSGSYIGELQAVSTPDGLRTVYAYSESGGFRTAATTVGAADPGNALSVLQGTVTTNVYDQIGQVVTNTVYDAASGSVISSTVRSNPDEFGRMRTVTHVDGTTEQTYYACCGVESTVDRDGVTTTYQYDTLKRQIASTRLNITATNVLDSAGRTLRTVQIGTDGSRITNSWSGYNTAGDLVASTNAFGGVTTYGHHINVQDRYVTTVTNADGGIVITENFADGSVASITGSAAHPVRYEHAVDAETGPVPFYTRTEVKLDAAYNDTSEWIKTHTDLFGRNFRVEYPKGAGSVSQYLYYNLKGQLWKTVDPDNVTQMFAYDRLGQQIDQVADLNGNGTIEYNTDRVVRTERWVTNGVFRTLQYQWQTPGSTNATLVAKQERTFNGLISSNFVVTGAANDPVSISRTIYLMNGFRYTTNTAQDGVKTIQEFSQGRLNYVAQHQTNSTTQIGKVTYAYDTHGRQSSVSDARNGATTYTYNPISGALESVTTPLPGTGASRQTTWIFYDSSGRVNGAQLSDGGATTNSFYLAGELKKSSGSRTYPVEYTYDAQGRQKTLKTWQNFAGNSGTATTTWNYDGERGWLANKRYADGLGPDYSYTDGGRLKVRTWARGVGTTNYYTAAGQLSGTAYSDSTSAITNAYLRHGLPFTTAQNAMTTTWTYTQNGLALKEAYTGGILAGLSVTNNYDAILRRSSVIVADKASTLNAYTYNVAGRLATVGDGTYSATYTYLANSPMVSQILYKSNTTTRMTTTKQYDFLDRLQVISSQPSGANAAPFYYGYRYNDANQRIRMTMADGSYWEYQYDALGQVISGKKYWADGVPVEGMQNEYAFDDIGNRKSTKEGGNSIGQNLRPASYTNNSLNQITGRGVPGYANIIGSSTAPNTVTVNSSNADYRRGSFYREELAISNSSTNPVWTGVTVSADTTKTGNLLTPPAGQTFSYDADGNLTNDLVWRYIWDGENQLVEIQPLTNAPAASKKWLTFAYDWQGRRIQKTAKWWTNSAWTTRVFDKYLYDRWNIIGELNATNNALVRGYIQGTDASRSFGGAGGVGGLISINAVDNGAHFPAFDGNGNVMGTTKSDGLTSAVYEYSPFGDTVWAWGPFATLNRIRFSTKVSEDVDLLDYGRRFYSPSSGWLNRDPIGEEGGLNVNGFVGNDPINFFDLNGLSWRIDRTGKDRATAVSDCGDTIADLALQIGLDENEFRYWLQVADGMDMPRSAEIPLGTQRRFTIPNKVLIVIGRSLRRDVHYLLFARAAELAQSALELGFSAEYLDFQENEDYDKATIIGHRRDMHGFMLMGHGDMHIPIFSPSRKPGAFVYDLGESEAKMITAPEMIERYHYGLVVAKFCSSGIGGWASDASKNGEAFITRHIGTLPFITEAHVYQMKQTLRRQSGK